MESSQGEATSSQDLSQEAVRTAVSAVTGLPRVFAGGRLSPLLRHSATIETEANDLSQTFKEKFAAKYPGLVKPIKFTTAQLHYLQNKAYTLEENPQGDGRNYSAGIKALDTPVLRITVEG